MNRVLYLDTSQASRVDLRLVIGNKNFYIQKETKRSNAQAVLEIIDQILESSNCKLSELAGINVNPGPGSFTGIRVGMTVAITICFIMKIPLNGQPIGEFVEPVYIPIFNHFPKNI